MCASVDVRQRILVCQLSRHHLSLAQGSHTGLKGMYVDLDNFLFFFEES